MEPPSGFTPVRKRLTSGNVSPGTAVTDAFEQPAPCESLIMPRLVIRRLPARYAGVAMPFFLSILMTFVVSGISTLKALGFSAAFLQTWPLSWALSWVVAFPTLLLVLPVVRRLVALVVAPPA